MSVKKLFNKNGGKIISSKTLENLLDDGMESASYVTEFSRDSEKFVPTVDFTKPAAFARYGSAEMYYADTISNIYKTFPYDGSLKEKISWHNTGSLLQRFIFEKQYPRTNGYVEIGKNFSLNVGSVSSQNWKNNNPEYILIKGGPHGPTNGYTFKDDIKLSKANVWHTGSNRDSNLKVDIGARGNTIEFWMKKTGWVADHASAPSALKETVFDLWTSSSIDGAPAWDNGRLRINMLSSDANFYIMCHSGSAAAHDNFELPIASGLATFKDSTWHHYAFVFDENDSKTRVRLFTDGEQQSEITSTKTFGQFNGNHATIGAQTAVSGTTGDLGWNTLSASLDEFRFWKTARTPKEIRRFWKFQVGGGTNTDTSNVNLGVYYKFNEGVVGSSTKDSVVLDYSGRVSNGSWIGYQSGARHTESAMVESGHTTSEYKDPIIYSSHPNVQSLYNKKVEEGKDWDSNNNSSIYGTLPSWLIDSDTESTQGGTQVLKKLTQVMASYFDTLQLQIDEVPKLKNLGYPSSSLGATFTDKPKPFTEKLLHSYGFNTAPIFSDISVLERFYNRNESASFGMKVDEIKNFIYQNIYNSLNTIYKSKGTERSLRNVLRCFGIDDELIKINMYANNATYLFTDNYRATSVDNKYVDFNDYIFRAPLNQTPFQATVYQSTDSINPNSVNYISGTNIFKDEYLHGFSFSAETEAIFPKKISTNKFLGQTPTLGTSSIFGARQVDKNNATTIKWMDGTTSADDHAQFKVYSVRSDENLEDARFAVDLSGSVTLSSDYFPEVYDNSKWNFAVSVSPEKKYIDLVSGSSGSIDASTGYNLEFYGVNRELGYIINEFHLSKSLSYDSGRKFVSAPKRIYAGAQRLDFTGSNLISSDVKIGHVRAWLDHLPTASVKAHALDPKNFGRSYEYGNSYFSQTQMSGATIRPIETLILNWDFENISSSATNGTFYVTDYSSGSNNYLSRYPEIFGNIVDKQHDARGQFFATSSNKVVDKFYVPAARKQLPELINSDNMINIVTQDDDVFTRESRPTQYFISLEKSMYQTISEEMINFFDTVQYFNNIIGDPVNKYRQDYKEMGKLRQLFFEKVQNTPDIEKYLSYYKWFDSAIIQMIYDLLPASANASDSLRNVIESHVLERNKYWNKFPTLEMNQPPPEGKILGINELLYNWKFGHASASSDLNKSSHTDQDENCLWFSERAERDSNVLTSGNSTVDSQRNTLKQIITTENSASGPRRKDADGTIYKGSTYVLRRLSKPYKFSIETSKHLDGGTNKNSNSIFGLHRQALKARDAGSYITLKKDLQQEPTCKDDRGVSGKIKIKGSAEIFSKEVSVETNTQDSYGKMKANLIAPFQIYSSSLGEGGYAAFVTSSNIDITNLHEDKYIIGNEVPMQGPFTEKYVGGLQHRHIDLNYSSSIRGIDTEATRPEAWYLRKPYSTSGIINLLSENFESYSSQLKFNTDSGFDNSPTTSTSQKYINYGADTPSFGFKFTTNFVYGGTTYTSQDGNRMLVTPNNYSEAGNISQGTDSPLTIPTDILGIVNHNNAKEFLLTTSEIDLTNVDTEKSPAPRFSFYYLMIGANPGTLLVQHSTDKQTYTTLTTSWHGTSAASITGQQGSAWRLATIDLTSYIGTKFYIRFINTGHPGFATQGYAAIDNIDLTAVVNNNAEMALYDINYKKLNIHADVGLTFDLDRPRATMYREEFAKRPVNIKNIKHQAATELPGAVAKYNNETLIEEQKGHQKLPTIIGNYEHNYQVVQTSGRNVNNMWFRSGSKGDGGVEDRPSNLNAVFGIQDYMMVDRGKLPDGSTNKTVIAERFSAPGDVSTLSRGYLDRASETFSVYNALPWRNWGVRRFLANYGSSSLLVQHSEKFGLRNGATHTVATPGNSAVAHYGDAGYFLTASYHKINRNPGYRLYTSGAIDADYEYNYNGQEATSYKTQNDNWLVQHSIPRSDTQYNWIWRSLNQKEKQPYNYLYASASGYNNYSPTAPWGHATASHQFTFLSASEIGSYVVYTTHNPVLGVTADGTPINARFFVNDFVGLNINVYEPVTSSTNTLGYFVDPSLWTSTGDRKNPYPTVFHLGHVAKTSKDVIVHSQMPGSILNSLLHHRNGPYHYPSWKQIRTGEHPVARHQRKNNIITLTREENVIGDKTPYDWHKTLDAPGANQRLHALRRVKSDGLRIYKYTEPPVSSKFKPMVATRPGDNSTVGFVYTYANNLTKFSNKALNVRLNISEVSNYHEQTDNKIYDTMINDNGIGSYRYAETVWPRAQHTYLNKTRKRTQYGEIEGLLKRGKDRISHNTFWKDRHTIENPDRMRTEGSASNSMGWKLSRFGGPKMSDGTYFMDYHPNKPMPFCDAVSVAQGRLNNHVVSASDNMDFGGTVLPFCNPSIGSTFMDMALSAWPLDEGKYGGILETNNHFHNDTPLLPQGGYYGPTYKQDWYVIYSASAGGDPPELDSLNRSSVLPYPAGQGLPPNSDGVNEGAWPHNPAGTGSFASAHGRFFRAHSFRGSYNLISGSTFGSHFVSGTFGMKGELAEDPSMNFLTSWASAYWACGTASYMDPYVGNAGGVDAAGTGSIVPGAATAGTVTSQNSRAFNWYVGTSATSPQRHNYGAIGGISDNTAYMTIHSGSEWSLKGWKNTPPPTFDTMFRGGYRRPYASPCFFRDPYNNFNIAGLSSSFSGGPGGKESGSAETIHKSGESHGNVGANANIKGEHYTLTNGVGEFIANTLDFSGALGYVKTAPYYRANKIAGKNPWYDTYENYVDDIRVFGQDYGVLAEFNMSENMDEYAQYDLDYTKPNPGLFTLKGQKSLSSSMLFPPGDSAMQYEETGKMNEQFLRRYCISDSMDYIHNKVSGDLESGIPKKIALRFDAITKLLPYYGFYPVTRTMQLATLFSQSIGPYLSCSLDNLSVNKKTYLGYHHSKEIWEEDSTVAGNDVEPGLEFITASQHPTFANAGIVGGYYLKDGVHLSTKLFNLADAGHEGAKGWKQALIDVHQAGKMQAMLQPTFAPGIMYNAIKSGIAVDYPIYINNRTPSIVASDDTEVGSNIKIKDHTNGAILRDAPNFRLPFETLYDLSNIPSSFLNSDNAAELGQETNTWGDGQQVSEVPKIYYTEPTWHMCGTDDEGNAKLGKEMAGSFYAVWSGKRGPLYEKAANNFLSEIPNFFLKNSGLTSFTSARSSQVKPLTKGRTYYMNVSLEIFDRYTPGGPSPGNPQAGSEFVMAEGPRKPLVPILDRGSQYQPLPRRGSIFGPALVKWNDRATQASSASWTGGPTATGLIHTTSGTTQTDVKGTSGELYNLTTHESDPCYAPYTPPYYYGKALYTMAYTHQPDFGTLFGNIAISTEDGLASAPIQGNRPSLDEIVTNIKINENTREINLFERPIYYRDDGTAVLAKDLAIRQDDAYAPPASGSGDLAYAHRMKMTASLDLFNIKDVITQAPDGTTIKDRVWEISTKFECPMINLSGSSYVGSRRHRPELSSDNNSGGAEEDGYFSDRTGRSIWMGYTSTNNNAESETKTLSDGTIVSFPRRGVKISLSDVGTTPENSLLHACGFKGGSNAEEQQSLSKYVGQVANKKQISEAIVAIPFLEHKITGVTHAPFEKYGVNINFIKIHPDEYYAQYENIFRNKPAVMIPAGPTDPPAPHARMNLFSSNGVVKAETSISRMIKMMEQYVIPPELDFFHRGIGLKDAPSSDKYLLTRKRFMNNEQDGISPFIMYIHEFARDLDSKDLGDIWQNLLPDAGMRAKKEASVINHIMSGPGSEFELWGRLDHLIDLASTSYSRAFNSTNIDANAAVLKKVFGPDQNNQGGLKWLIFKVKKRANMTMSQIKNKGYEKSFVEIDNNGQLGGSSVSGDTRLESRYSYNWPYDFFSLVETAKLTVEYEMT